MTSDVSALSGIVANGHQAIHSGSSAPSKIPYGGFSPVRLQTRLPDATFARASTRAYRRLPSASGIHPQLCPVTWICIPSGRAECRFRPSGPVALGSASGFAVRQPHRLLWPHPSFCAAPPVSFIAGGPGASQKVPTFICQSWLTCRRPYSDGSKRVLTNPHPWFSLRQLGRGSATICFPHTGLQRRISRSCNVHLMLRPASLLAPLRTGRLRPSLPALDRSRRRSVMTTGTFVSSLTGLAPAALTALWAALRVNPNAFREFMFKGL
jgi:hypothetical protein